MPPEAKAHTEKLMKLVSEIGTLFNDSVKKEEFLALFEKLTKRILTVHTELSQKIDETQKNADNSVESLRTELLAVEKSLSQMLSDLGVTNGKSLETVMNDLQSKIEEVRSLIPTLPDYTEDFNTLRTRLGEIRPDTSEEIRNKLELFVDEEEKLNIDAIGHLRKELDELKEEVKKKAVSGNGSGITNPIHWARHEAFTMDGVATSVTLTQVIGAEGNACIVRYQGQTLDMDTHYTTNGNTVTLVGFTPQSGDIISVTYWP